MSAGLRVPPGGGQPGGLLRRLFFCRAAARCALFCGTLLPMGAALREKMRDFSEKHAAVFGKTGSAFSRKMQRFRPRGAGERAAERGAGACAVRGNCVHLPPNQPARWGWAGSYLSVKRTFQAYLPSSNFATSRKNREETATGASALDVSSCAPGREPARHLCDIIWTWAGCALPILGKGNAKA